MNFSAVSKVSLVHPRIIRNRMTPKRHIVEHVGDSRRTDMELETLTLVHGVCLHCWAPRAGLCCDRWRRWRTQDLGRASGDGEGREEALWPLRRGRRGRRRNTANTSGVAAPPAREGWRRCGQAPSDVAVAPSRKGGGGVAGRRGRCGGADQEWRRDLGRG
jgi:hypothetical protein